MAQQDITLRYLNQAQLEKAGLNMKLALDVVEEALRLHALKDDVLPHKISLDLGEPKRGRVNIMPGYIGGDFDICGLKWIAIFPNNPRRFGIPSLTGLMILGDPDRGVPIAVMESSLITSLRTGAASGVAAKYLARSDSTTIAILGAGVQGRTQLEAIHAVLPRLTNVHVYDIYNEASIQFASDMETTLGIQVTPVETPKQCVLDADVIVTATVADEAIVKDAWVKEGSLFIHAGSNQEEEYDVVYNSNSIYVDDWGGMVHRRSQTLARMRESSLIDDDAITAELGQVITGEKPGRQTDNERTYFCSVGLATEDAALAHAALKLAESKGIGTPLPLYGS
jgi:ornithine cyclodeaminase